MDTKQKVEALIDRDIDILYSSLTKTKTKRMEKSDAGFVLSLMEIWQQKEAIEAVSKLDAMETDALELLLKELKNARDDREKAGETTED